MYKQKVVIADDERVTLQGLRFVIEDSCPDVEIVGEFYNGKDVMEYISTNPVDIIVIDICMPVMTGLDVLKYIYEKKKDIKTVIITGYKDFEYARTAIQYNCYTLLTKPLDFDKVTQVINELCKENLENILSIQESTKHILKEREQQRMLLTYFMNSILSFDELSKKIDNIKELENKCCVVELFSNESISYESWCDICEINNQNINIYCVSSSENYAKLLVFFKENKASSNQMHLNLFLGDIVHIIKASFGTTVTQNVKWYDSLREIRSDKGTLNLDKIADYFLRYIMKFTDEENVNSILYSCTLDDYIEISKSLVQKIGIRFSLDFSEYIRRIENATDIQTVKDLMFSIRDEIRIDADFPINRIKNYLYDNCGENLRMDKVAEYFGYNYSYFSRIFKKKIGDSFSDYIAAVRLERTKELLKKGISIEQIAEEVGYDISYVKKKFKMETGLSIKEFLDSEGV
ncbi:MAG: response regulator [Clostridia bacterium]|nr:response regulator [Clostridia bacterium]